LPLSTAVEPVSTALSTPLPTNRARPSSTATRPAARSSPAMMSYSPGVSSQTPPRGMSILILRAGSSRDSRTPMRPWRSTSWVPLASSCAMSISLPGASATVSAPIRSAARPWALVRTDMPTATGSLTAESPQAPPAGRADTAPSTSLIRPTQDGGKSAADTAELANIPSAHKSSARILPLIMRGE